MKNVYACLLGEWVNLSNKENIIIDNSYNDANHWFREKMIRYLTTIILISRLTMLITVFTLVLFKF